MPRNGNGDYDLPAGNPVVPGTVIESDWANNTMNDVAAALTDSLTADGQTTPINNLPMGGFHHTGVSDPTLRNQYATLGMTQDGKNNRIQSLFGVDNLTGTLVGQATAYASGAIYSFFAPDANTGPMTLSFNGLAAKSITTSQGLPLVAADLIAGNNYLIQYTGTVFQLLTPVTSQAGTIYTQSAVTGWKRPETGLYPPLTLGSGTSVNIPAGSGVIVPPGADGANDAYAVSWVAQSVTLSYLTSSFSTTIAIDGTGAAAQFAGRITGADERGYIILGVAIHVNGTATSVTTTPAIYGDNGYLNVDTSRVLSNVLISGGEATPAGANLLLNVAGGIISQPGGNFSSPNNPNTITLVGGTPISFRTLAGQGTVGASVVTIAPVTQYDPNGSGVVTALPGNNDCTIHRLYYLFGDFIWVYGQRVYANLLTALNYLEVDRSKYVPSTQLSDATLIAEIITNKNNDDLSDDTKTAFITYGGAYFSIGNSGGIGEAPLDGLTYGRRNATWSQTVASNTPDFTGDVQITKTAPKVIETFDPVAAGYAGLNIKQLGFDWCNVEATYPDDKTYLRSYDPANGTLRNTTTWDLATGVWTFPANVAATTFNGIDLSTLATSSSVTAGLALKANIDSPALTGVPTAPTAAAGTNNTQLATTAFVNASYVKQVGGTASHLVGTPTGNTYNSGAFEATGDGATLLPRVGFHQIGVYAGSVVMTQAEQFSLLGTSETPCQLFCASVVTTGDIGAYFSDERLKTVTGEVEDALQKVNSQDVVHYHPNEVAASLGYDMERQEVGFLAGQVRKVMPSVISLAPVDRADAEGKLSKSGEDYLTMDYGKMTPLLAAAIKELLKRVEVLEAEVKKHDSTD